jgi:hypothetical protein
MPNVIVYSKPDGGIATVFPAKGVSTEYLVESMGLPDAGHAVIDSDQLPADHTLRDAWVLVDGKVSVDPVKAKSLIPVPLTPTEKLAAAGLTVDELKALLAS